MAMMYQCRLQRDSYEVRCWIEERGAKVGNSVELKSLDGKFWAVTEVFTPGMEKEKLREKQANDRNSLPSIVGQS